MDGASLIDKQSLPIIIIDNIQLAEDLGMLMQMIKSYADKGVLKVVLVCSSGEVAFTLNEMSSVDSRGEV